jgi:hypothetical protein
MTKKPRLGDDDPNGEIAVVPGTIHVWRLEGWPWWRRWYASCTLSDCDQYWPRPAFFRETVIARALDTLVRKSAMSRRERDEIPF